MPRKKVIVEDNQIVAEIPMEKDPRIVKNQKRADVIVENHQRSIREHKQKAFDTYVAMKINKGHTNFILKNCQKKYKNVFLYSILKIKLR
mgnify:CR=1 FL=1